MSTANSTKFMQKGFTLLELLVVIAIIGILSSIILVSYNGYAAKARIARTLQWAGSINHSLGDRAVGVWTFDNISGSAVYDDSGLGNNGTINKGGNGTGCDIVDGVVGRAMSFDGVDDYVDVTSSTSLSPTGAITIGAWIKTSNNAITPQEIVDKRDPSNTGSYLFRMEGGYIAFYFYNAGWKSLTDTTNLLQNNAWYYAVATYDQSNIRLYINGVQVKSVAQTASLGINSASVNIGRRSGASIQYFNGLIDDVRIFSEALT